MFISPSAPVVESERLRLRGHAVSDYDNCYRLWSSPDVTRFIGGVPSTREDVWSRLVRYRGHWAFMGYGYWVVEERSTGSFLGEIGFADMRRDISPSLSGMPEAGWALVPETHGKGFASEGVAAALGWADRHFGSLQTCCIIAPDNTPSIRVAQKCGFVEFARTTYKTAATIQYRRSPRP